MTAADKVITKLLERFDKYPDPMGVKHMADLLGVKPHVIYYMISTYPEDLPHIRLGVKLIFPKARVVPWWMGKTGGEEGRDIR